jgi:anti-anti-sigma regulatory factor
MTCLVAHTFSETIIQLSDFPDEDEFEAIEGGFESALDRRTAKVIIDLTDMRQVDASLAALLGLLRLQARRAGISLELRNLAEDTCRQLVSYGYRGG